MAMEAKARCDQGLAEAAAAMRARTNRNCHQRLVQAIGGVVDVDEVLRLSWAWACVCLLCVCLLCATVVMCVRCLVCLSVSLHLPCPFGRLGSLRARGHGCTCVRIFVHNEFTHNFCGQR